MFKCFSFEVGKFNLSQIMEELNPEKLGIILDILLMQIQIEIVSFSEYTSFLLKCYSGTIAVKMGIVFR